MRRVVKHRVVCGTEGCEETIGKVVNRRDIRADGSVKGMTVFCRTCKRRAGDGMTRNIGGYNGRNYTGATVEDLSRAVEPEQMGVVIIVGAAARAFEALYKSPSQLAAEEMTTLQPFGRDDWI